MAQEEKSATQMVDKKNSVSNLLPGFLKLILFRADKASFAFLSLPQQYVSVFFSVE
jgi:hypothetical protein